MPAVLSLRPIKGEKLALWQTAWLQERLAELKQEVNAIEEELARREGDQ
jgi:uncharacterized small protein (DUF1192 family)